MAGLWSTALKAALSGFAALGLDTNAIIEQAGISKNDLDDPDGRIPLQNAGKIWPLAEKQWALPGLGLWTGGALAFGSLPTVDYTLATASTVGEGMTRLSRYWAMSTGGVTGIEVSLDAATDQLAIELRGYAYPQLRDYVLAMIANKLRTVGAAPQCVLVAGAPAAPRAEYVSKLGCPVTLEAKVTRLVLARGAHRNVPPPRYPGLRLIMEREAERLLASSRAGKDPLAAARRELTSMLGPEPVSLDELARRLGLTRRKLQRLLAQERTTFPKLVDQCRHALAEQHLTARALNISELAYLLGFSEPSAFSRAFKRWTGKAPADFRAAAARVTRAARRSSRG